MDPPARHRRSAAAVRLAVDPHLAGRQRHLGCRHHRDAHDEALRATRDVDVWERVVHSYPLVAHWTNGEPLDDNVAVMAKIEDRHRAFVVDGEPVVTGVAALGDAWACTNPSLGHGATIGLLHACTLRDTIGTPCARRPSRLRPHVARRHPGHRRAALSRHARVRSPSARRDRRADRRRHLRDRRSRVAARRSARGVDGQEPRVVARDFLASSGSTSVASTCSRGRAWPSGRSSSAPTASPRPGRHAPSCSRSSAHRRLRQRSAR